MNPTIARIAVALLLCALASPAAARARQQEPPAAAAGLSPAEIARWLDAYGLVQAQEALRLTDAQYGQFVTRMKALQELRRRNQQARNHLLQDLRRLAGDQSPGAGDESLIRERLKALLDHDQRAAADLRKAYEALDGILDLRQQARFRLFEENMERRKFELLMRVRQGTRANQPRRRPDPR